MPDRTFANVLGKSLSRISERIIEAGSGNYISRVIKPATIQDSVTETECKARQLRLQQFRNQNPQEVDAICYSRFVGALYPITDNLGRFPNDEVTSAPVNHTELFNAYCFLPQPGVAYIKPQDFEKFMSQMLTRRDFVRPNALSPTSKFYYLSEQIILSFYMAQKVRKSHLSNFWRVAQDMNIAKVPVTRKEQRQLLFMTLYKDRQDILDMVDEAFQTLSKALEHYSRLEEMYRTATETQYSPETLAQFRHAFKDDLDIDTLNVFLLIALRHKDKATVSELLKQMKSLEPNRNTFQVLLENYAFNGNIERFSSVLEVICTDHPHLIDIKLVNTLLRSLIRLNIVGSAETIVSLFNRDKSILLARQESFLKQMTIDDRETYNRYWMAYEQSKDKPLMSLYPTEDTFLPLLSLYCTSNMSVSFDTILNLLFQAEQVWGIPITSRTYKLLFHSFTRQDSTIEDLKFITGKLVASHDIMYEDKDSWLQNQMLDVDLPQNVMDALNLAMDNKYLPVFRSNKGQFIKLSDELVLGIYKAFDHVLGGEPELQRKAASAHELYRSQLMIARDDYNRSVLPGPTLLDLNTRDEFMYIKKGFIIDLLDIVS